MKWPQPPAVAEGAPGTPSTSPVGMSPWQGEGWPWLLQPCRLASSGVSHLAKASLYKGI